MYWLASCPRCYGDLIGNNDMYGGFISCIQCGHHLTEAEEPNLRYDSPLGGTGLFPPVVHIKIPPMIAA